MLFGMFLYVPAWKLPYALHRNLFPDVLPRLAKVAVIMTCYDWHWKAGHPWPISETGAHGSPTMGRAESVRKEWEVPLCQGVDGWNGRGVLNKERKLLKRQCGVNFSSLKN